jgi:hypothetical protein
VQATRTGWCCGIRSYGRQRARSSTEDLCISTRRSRATSRSTSMGRISRCILLAAVNRNVYIKIGFLSSSLLSAQKRVAVQSCDKYLT